MVRMARRPVRPPERAGNSGLNVVRAWDYRFEDVLKGG
jgi:hypothetical protein